MSKPDIFTLDIIQNALQAIANEMFAAMRDTAMSPIIYEVLDMGTGITDAYGNLASSGAGMPAFVGVLDKSIRQLLRQYPQPGDLEPGDIFIVNDPYHGGVTHLNDIVLAMPVFVDDELTAWTANIAHWNDVSGGTPGSMSTDASSIYQEGLRLPPVKLIARGEPLEPVMRILGLNTRMPDFMAGDLWAGVAAVREGAQRIEGLCAKFGRATFLQAVNDFMELGEAKSRHALRALPMGSFSLAAAQDDGRIFNVTVHIGTNGVTIDLRDNPDQSPGPHNLSRDGTEVAAQMAFKSMTDVQRSANAGTFRPLTVLTRPGSVFDPLAPAAQGFYFENLVRVHDLILQCIAPHMPNRLPAGNFSSICATVIGGTHPDTGRGFMLIEPEIGGWGAGQGYDGNSAVFSSMHGETFNCPAEISETRYGIDVDSMALNDEAGGHGQFRGGRGIRVDYRIRATDAFLTCGYTRARIPPWGLNGGADGTLNYVEILRADGRHERHAMASGLRLAPGDVVRVRTGTGGGYGDPALRTPDAVRSDVRNGYISAAEASDIYGCTVIDDTSSEGSGATLCTVPRGARSGANPAAGATS
ncbi:hydantoinase B/oxoprolinase family protein [Pusillimonas sp. TS35]|uniref:hydantoinase B/oxoprolinase family protein n=1 Tax=Paracandidimonas lactea TaxID=2895524 RepID=UPI0013698598|nr:hydantoinase B/oxoprolinase family protein [Paracandidimonas lactea]MYN13567.1 hydantoinase B/oxoprolinase family protein [Pusillimonas sp. TS35]